MNNILQVKGRFTRETIKPSCTKRNLPYKESYLATYHVQKLVDELKDIKSYFEQSAHSFIKGALISAYYKGLVDEKNRITALLRKDGSKANDAIRATKIVYNSNGPQHVITYFVGYDVLVLCIERLLLIISIINENFKGKIKYSDIETLYKDTASFRHKDKIKKQSFIDALVEAFYVKEFKVDSFKEHIDSSAIVTLYKTALPPELIFDRLKLGYLTALCSRLNGSTFLLEKDQIELLQDKAPYLIATMISDKVTIPHVNYVKAKSQKVQTIPAPMHEPIIGVLDTPCSLDTYFKDWVTSESALDTNIKLEPSDYMHGTAVTSIIVDGPSLNLHLDDGCGRFRVKHFAIACKQTFSISTLIKAISHAIRLNIEIKVWTLALGPLFKTDPNFICALSSELDEIQNSFDVIIVIAGHDVSKHLDNRESFAPLDSINSLVVNAISSDTRAPRTDTAFVTDNNKDNTDNTDNKDNTGNRDNKTYCKNNKTSHKDIKNCSKNKETNSENNKVANNDHKTNINNDNPTYKKHAFYAKSLMQNSTVSYYGGDTKHPIRVSTPIGECLVQDPSFAAAWITRKLAYLIYILGFSREVAKALIIDVARGWDKENYSLPSRDYPLYLVPKHISDLVSTAKDEIRFIMMGSTNAYERYTYKIPIPIYKESYPFYTKATLCYFSQCAKERGLDYNQTKIDIKFGRFKEEGKSIVIKSIEPLLKENYLDYTDSKDSKDSKNSGDCTNSKGSRDSGNCTDSYDCADLAYSKGLSTQILPSLHKSCYTYANVKNIGDKLKNRVIPRKVYNQELWGLCIKTKNLERYARDKRLPFGIVITLKEMHGKNRMDDFIKHCSYKGLFTYAIEIDKMVIIYNKGQEQITLS